MNTPIINPDQGRQAMALKDQMFKMQVKLATSKRNVKIYFTDREPVEYVGLDIVEIKDGWLVLYNDAANSIIKYPNHVISLVTETLVPAEK